MLNLLKRANLRILISSVACFLALTVILIVVTCVNAKPDEPKLDTKDDNADNSANSTLPVAKEPTIYDYLVLERNISGYTLASVRDYPESVLLIPAESQDGLQITAIGDGAFSGCKDLLEITIPATVKSIGNVCFAGASSLVAANVEPANPYYCSVGGVLFSKDKTELICYPTAKVGSTYLLSTNVKRIAPYAFDGVINLKAINYEGSAAKYQKIEIGTGNQVFTSLPVTCNYVGAK